MGEGFWGEEYQYGRKHGWKQVGAGRRQSWVNVELGSDVGAQG